MQQQGQASRAIDAEEAYLAEVRGHKLLTREEEMELGHQVQSGVEPEASAARAQLVECNQRLVLKCALSYVRRGVDFMDLVQEGNEGLLRAIKVYDPWRGYRFATCATWWIRQAISRAVHNQGRVVRLPVHVHERYRRCQRARDRLLLTQEREPANQEVAEEVQVSLAHVDALDTCMPMVLALSVPTGGREDETLGDRIVDSKAEAEGRLLRSDSLADIGRAMQAAKLTGRERRVLAEHFGLDGRGERRYEEVARGMGLSRQRVEQLDKQARKRIAESDEAVRILWPMVRALV